MSGHWPAMSTAARAPAATATAFPMKITFRPEPRAAAQIAAS
jgi:hypothetical protein